MLVFQVEDENSKGRSHSSDIKSRIAHGYSGRGGVIKQRLTSYYPCSRIIILHFILEENNEALAFNGRFVL